MHGTREKSGMKREKERSEEERGNNDRERERERETFFAPDCIAFHQSLGIVSE